MRGLLESIESSQGVRDFIEHLKGHAEKHSHAGPIKVSTSVPGSAKSLTAFLIFKHLNRPVLYVVKGLQEGDSVYDDVFNYAVKRARIFPSWETLPHEGLHPHPEIVADRFRVLRDLADDEYGKTFVIATLQSLMQKVISPERLKSSTFMLTVAQDYDREKLLEKLVDSGYERLPIVEEKSKFSVRGGIVDIFPVTEDLPVRLEFFGDTIESIRQFDPVNQVSTQTLRSVQITPADEFEFNEKHRYELVTLFDHLSDDTIIIYDEFDDIDRRFDELHAQVPVEMREFEDFNALCQNANSRMTVMFNELAIGDAEAEDKIIGLPFEPLYTLRSSKFTAVREETRLEVFESIPVWLDEDYGMYFVCNNKAEEDRLREIFKERKIRVSDKMHFIIGNLTAGFFVSDTNTICVPDREIFHRYKIRRGPRKFKGTAPIRDFSDLQPGDYAVHLHHGIGIYRGLVHLEKMGPVREFLAVEYADKSKLYVPIAQANLVTKYIGADKRKPKIDALDSGRWLKVKAITQRSIEDYATELLELYAVRESQNGTEFPRDTLWQKEFEDAFIYEETDDQQKAVEKVKEDMENHTPMDRLICGDVGYGKTEVAIRAAFKTVMHGKQVAILVPTTVLAQQHYHTFCDRMADYPIQIEVLSRFRKPREIKQTLSDLKGGKVDIVIGTHRVIQKDVKFSDIGLVIVDEEQRFGVKHKEYLKQLRKVVDVLTMTATPIPRTLYLSLVGARDMSNIDTPPLDRLPVKTILIEYDKEVVRQAIQRELNRQGQVFYLHNRVKTIEKVKDGLQKLLPHATIVVGHGQMSENELETVMEKFVDGKIDVLVCTTIIESGLDIPNANTIIIDRADRFGLADLYQLRGRVGRWKHQAYAYLVVPKSREILETAKKRLRAILDSQGYGAGFQIAMHDLEIRGAGNILGTEQSGHINAIGFALYCKLLKRTVEGMKGIHVPLPIDVQIKLPLDALIPETYIPEAAQRIDMYKRLADIVTEDELESVRSELLDRYGEQPYEIENLLNVVSLRLFAEEYAITRIELDDDKVIAEQGGKRIMTGTRFPRIGSADDRTIVEEIKKTLKNLLG